MEFALITLNMLRDGNLHVSVNIFTVFPHVNYGGTHSHIFYEEFHKVNLSAQ